ncbi:hypothetical protein QWT69_06375 [Sporosarcina oncorhynchi]|uniref:Pilus assembly protein PilO n=1 Tax=Sporosarcina oncorhynchi TaxID=3056444 RepID=A0ABZ0LAV8_9BACL|nr:hypothetical protein [Sporosarcina sp. T2O-4]WOV88729.1 hypothetical protein QWT69_06375 [Sporosarcina sp. T2O-4]
MNTNKRTLNLLLTLLMIVVIFSAFYYFLSPLKNSVKSTKSNIETAEQEKRALEARLEASGWEQDSGDERELITKLPKDRDVQMIIQLLQEAELTTGSVIQSIVFNDYDESATNKQLPGLSEADEEESAETVEETGIEDQNNPGSSTELSEPPVTKMTIADIPPTLQLLTLQISVVHEDYEQLYSFIEEIEKHERIITIEGVQLNLPGEMINIDQLETASSSIQLTTFYMKD